MLAVHRMTALFTIILRLGGIVKIHQDWHADKCVATTEMIGSARKFLGRCKRVLRGWRESMLVLCRLETNWINLLMPSMLSALFLVLHHNDSRTNKQMNKRSRATLCAFGLDPRNNTTHTGRHKQQHDTQTQHEMQQSAVIISFCLRMQKTRWHHTIWMGAQELFWGTGTEAAGRRRGLVGVLWVITLLPARSCVWPTGHQTFCSVKVFVAVLYM